MWIIVAVVILLSVLGSVFRLLILSALIKRKRMKTIPAAKVQTEPKLPKLPDSPEISDEELKNKLDSLKK